MSTAGFSFTSANRTPHARELNPLFSNSSARFARVLKITLLPNPFIFYRLRTFSDNYRGWGCLPLLSTTIATIPHRFARSTLSTSHSPLPPCLRGPCTYTLADSSSLTNMIAQLRGTLTEKRPNQIIVDVGGVGYLVSISLSTFYALAELHQEISLLIHTHVREDSLALYGFLTAREKQLFESLLSVSGVGPTLAIKILSGMSADDLVPAIRHGDLPRLTRIPGVGKKTAERLVVELRDKLAAMESSEAEPAPSRTGPAGDVISALLNLGYDRRAAEAAVEDVERGAGSAAAGKTFESLLRAALQQLSSPAQKGARPPRRCGVIQFVWEFLARADKVAEFERHYAASGAWAELFRKSVGYQGTELLRDAENSRRYLTVDRWESEAAYRAMRERFAKEYETINQACAEFTELERSIGAFEETGSRTR